MAKSKNSASNTLKRQTKAAIEAAKLQAQIEANRARFAKPKGAADREKKAREELRKEIQSFRGKTWVEQYRKGNTLVKGHWRKVSVDAKPKDSQDEAKLKKAYKNMRGKADEQALRASKDITKFGKINPPDPSKYRIYADAETAKAIAASPNSTFAKKYIKDEYGNYYSVKYGGRADRIAILNAADQIKSYAKKAGYKVDTTSAENQAKGWLSVYVKVKKPVYEVINGRREKRYVDLPPIRLSDHSTGARRWTEELQITKDWNKEPLLTDKELYDLAKII